MQLTRHSTDHSPEDSDSGEAIARGLQKASDSRDRTISSVERFVKWAYGFAAVIVAITVYTVKIQWDVAQIKEAVSANKAEIKLLHEQHEADRLTAQIQKAFDESVTIQIGAINKELDKRTLDFSHVSEMWFMKEHGISNREDFERKNGYPPPK